MRLKRIKFKLNVLNHYLEIFRIKRTAIYCPLLTCKVCRVTRIKVVRIMHCREFAKIIIRAIQVVHDFSAQDLPLVGIWLRTARKSLDMSAWL